jgi:PAC2 family
MGLFEMDDPGPLQAPALVVAFDGWVNAGSAGTAAAAHLAGDGTTIGRFDADALFDYRASRPTLEFVDGVLSDVEYPEVSLRHTSMPLAGTGSRDVLVLSGIEPNWNWQALGSVVADCAVELGVVEHVSLGGIPWATPHTRPTTIIETASRADLLSPGADRPEGVLRAPGSAVSVVEAFVAERGIPTRGYWARVPHYVGAVYVPSVVALVERASAHLGVGVDYAALLDAADEQRRRLDEILEERPEAKAMVEQLEQIAASAEGSVSGEALAAEIERFLQQRDRDNPWNGGES